MDRSERRGLGMVGRSGWHWCAGSVGCCWVPAGDAGMSLVASDEGGCWAGWGRGWRVLAVTAVQAMQSVHALLAVQAKGWRGWRRRWERVLLQGGMEGERRFLRDPGNGGPRMAVRSRWQGLIPGVWELPVSRAAGGSADLGTADGRGQSGDQGAGLLFVGPVWGGAGAGAAEVDSVSDYLVSPWDQ